MDPDGAGQEIAEAQAGRGSTPAGGPVGGSGGLNVLCVTRRRARHVVTETARVAAAVQALERGDMEALGRLLVEGHASLRDSFESSLPAIDALEEEVLAEPGVLGARLQGAGWGGRLVVLRRTGGQAD